MRRRDTDYGSRRAGPAANLRMAVGSECATPVWQRRRGRGSDKVARRSDPSASTVWRRCRSSMRLTARGQPRDGEAVETLLPGVSGARHVGDLWRIGNVRHIRRIRNRGRLIRSSGSPCGTSPDPNQGTPTGIALMAVAPLARGPPRPSLGSYRALTTAAVSLAD